ncbi:MAG TPA: hypothetical protein PKY96_11605 [Flavobacteriales bacterium]|nr:hypothetical protein [Flavobacteriales bacterium]
MRNARFALFALVLIAVVACAARNNDDAPPTGAQDLTPPSELALLMREMASHADSVKAGLARGDKKLPPYPAGVKKLLTATPTRDMHIDPITFPTFATDYQAKVAALYKAARKDRAHAYNALVLSCANCHTTHCPGPMMRIKKMYVKVD